MPARCCVDNCMSGPFQLRAARVLFILNLDKMPMSVVGVMSMLMKMVVQQKDGSEFIVNVISNAGSYGYPYLQVIPVEGKVMTSGGLGVGYRALSEAKSAAFQGQGGLIIRPAFCPPIFHSAMDN